MVYLCLPEVSSALPTVNTSRVVCVTVYYARAGAIFVYNTNLYLTWQVSLEQIILYNNGLHRPNPDDSGSIVRRPVGYPITAGCETAWNQTRVSEVTPQALRCSALDRCATRDNPIFTYSPLCAMVRLTTCHPAFHATTGLNNFYKHGIVLDIPASGWSSLSSLPSRVSHTRCPGYRVSAKTKFIK